MKRTLLNIRLFALTIRFVALAMVFERVEIVFLAIERVLDRWGDELNRLDRQHGNH